MCVLLPCTTNEIGIPLMPLTTFCTNYVCFFLIEMTFVNVSKVALFALLVDIVVAIGVAVVVIVACRLKINWHSITKR